MKVFPRAGRRLSAIGLIATSIVASLATAQAGPFTPGDIVAQIYQREIGAFRA